MSKLGALQSATTSEIPDPTEIHNAASIPDLSKKPAALVYLANRHVLPESSIMFRVAAPNEATARDYTCAALKTLVGATLTASSVQRNKHSGKFDVTFNPSYVNGENLVNDVLRASAGFAPRR